ncbi:MAG: prepilin peptidase [Lachnospiraceae bacterium]|nr:prepilin peptidase [Lachnospiraceae bacterium]
MTTVTVSGIFAFVLLLVCGYTDFRKRAVDLRFVLGMTLASFVLRVITKDKISNVIITYVTILLGTLLFCQVTKGGFGEGDAYVLAALSILLDGVTLIGSLLTGLILAAFMETVLIIAGYRKISDSFAFIPFLFCGYILLLGMEYF